MPLQQTPFFVQSKKNQTSSYRCFNSHKLPSKMSPGNSLDIQDNQIVRYRLFFPNFKIRIEGYQAINKTYFFSYKNNLNNSIPPLATLPFIHLTLSNHAKILIPIINKINSLKAFA